MKQVLLFGAGKSATFAIDHLVNESQINHWKLTVIDSNLSLAQSKIGHSPNANALSIDVNNEMERKQLIAQADVVISLLPPFLHILVAKDCVLLKKNLLTASYTDAPIKALENDIKKNGLLFLYEMGLDPGIDHMSALSLIHQIKNQGGQIHTFKSHTGGLIAPESDDNPWQYKISWNPRNVVLAGNAGAVYKEKNSIIHKEYQTLFENNQTINVDGIGGLAYYPNRDSLSYIPLYDLAEAETFIRTTLRYPIFCKAWKPIVAAGLTDDKKPLETSNLSFHAWSSSIVPLLTTENQPLLQFLGLFETGMVPVQAKTSADILQYLLEQKLAMKPADKDMIVMVHELEYKKEGQEYYTNSSLIVKGENNIRTAMAKTVGLPLAIAAKLILQEKLKLTGLHIPILAEIYEPILKELKNYGIQFEEKTQKV
jgi:saccharopine dehydrogenase-like NADP-dependent oxidoreductase